MENDKLEALHLHVRKGRYLEVQSLVNEGVDPNGKNRYGETPLTVAARFSYRATVKLLINSGADIDCRDEDGWTVLHRASCKGWLDVVQCLVSKGAALDVKNFDGETPLMVAARWSNRTIVELLINLGADIDCHDEDGRTVLHHASSAGSLKIVQYLVNKGVALNTKNSKGETPLSLSVYWDRIEVVECLVNKGAALDTKNSKSETPLMAAARCSYRAIVTLLIHSGADIHQCCDGRTILHYASYMGWVDVVQCLVSKGAALDTANHNGEIPLYLAVDVSEIQVAEYLLRAGADCNLVDNEGESPFSCLIKKNKPNVQLIKLCIEKGAYVKATDYKKMLEVPLLKKVILRDTILSSQLIINKFNNRDLPSLYERLASVQRLPPIDRMKIGSKMALEIKRAVAHKIQANGFCNVLEMVPLSLGMLCVKSLEKSRAVLNQANPSAPTHSSKRLRNDNRLTNNDRMAMLNNTVFEI